MRIGATDGLVEGGDGVICMPKGQPDGILRGRRLEGYQRTVLITSAVVD